MMPSCSSQILIVASTIAGWCIPVVANKTAGIGRRTKERQTRNDKHPYAAIYLFIVPDVVKMITWQAEIKNLLWRCLHSPRQDEEEANSSSSRWTDKRKDGRPDGRKEGRKSICCLCNNTKESISKGFRWVHVYVCVWVCMCECVCVSVYLIGKIWPTLHEKPLCGTQNIFQLF